MRHTYPKTPIRIYPTSFIEQVKATREQYNCGLWEAMQFCKARNLLKDNGVTSETMAAARRIFYGFYVERPHPSASQMWNALLGLIVTKSL